MPFLISSSSGHLARESLKDLATQLLFRHPYTNYKEDLHIHMPLAAAFCASHVICGKGMAVFPASQERGEFSISELLTRADSVLVLIHLFKTLPFDTRIKGCFSQEKNKSSHACSLSAYSHAVLHIVIFQFNTLKYIHYNFQNLY